jgi:carbon-monoxide dehydrogenase small subunit
VVAIHDLLARDPEPSPLAVREALAGNLCRCTGYGRILAAIQSVVTRRTAPAADPDAGTEPGTPVDVATALNGTRAS